MNLQFLVSFILLLFSVKTFGQNFTESNLPIIVINTGGEEIPDDPKIPATMGIIENGQGQINKLTDPFNDFDGNIGIETRGNSTQGFDKKTYSVELWDTDKNDISAKLLGMAKEEDWILHAMVIDKAQLRIPMSFHLFQKMGHYASNWRFVELVLDGEYQGLYLLVEKIKRDKNRVDIAKLDADDLAGDSLTGGYILRIDWLDGDGFESNFNSQGGDNMVFQWYYPKAENIKPAQENYIKNHVHDWEEAIFSNNYKNASGKRYDEYINVSSFVDYLLINELSKNSDGYKLSTYFHKDRDDRGGKFTMGPIWDFDQSYGHSLVCSCDNFRGWTYLQTQDRCEDLETMPRWWRRFMSDSVFLNRVGDRWRELRTNVLHQDSIMTWIDTNRAIIGNAVERNYERWDFLGENIWIQPEPIPETYEEEIINLKTWIINRLNWLDDNMPKAISGADSIAPEDFKIVPNPADYFVQILGAAGHEIEIHDTNGKKVKVETLRSNQHRINVSQLSSGVYFLSIFKNREKVATKKIVLFK